MISILALCLMVVVAVMVRPASVRRANRTSAARPRANSSSKPARPANPAGTPGVVTYALMKDRKLPSPAQRAMRRLMRPFLSLRGWFGGTPKPGPLAGPVETDARRPARPSAELENFLDARNREIARRKAEGATKPGPDDRLH